MRPTLASALVASTLTACSGAPTTAEHTAGQPSAEQPSAEQNTASCAPITPGGMEASPGARFEDVDDATARAWTPSPDLRAEATSRTEGGTLVVTVTLTNTASEERDAIYLTGGAMFASTNPLSVTVPLTPRPMPAAALGGPEVYPAPRRAILPPGGTLRTSAAICPDAYEHTPGQRVDLAWSLELWSEPKPRGTLSVALP